MVKNILDTIVELQGRRLNDAQIVAQLKNLGYTQQEISDAVNQFKAKAAVSEGEKGGEMQPSIMERGDAETAAEEIPVPMPSVKKTRKVGKTKEYRAGIQAAETPESYPYAYPAQATPSYAEVQTPVTAGGAGAGIGDIETIEEIAEEIVAEKFSKIGNKIESVFDFKELIETKIQDLDDRLKRMEASIDRLQAALLGKVQEYSRDIKSLGSEMHALEGAFGKILNPLVDNVKELGKITDNLKKKRKKDQVV